MVRSEHFLLQVPQWANQWGLHLDRFCPYSSGEQEVELVLICVSGMLRRWDDSQKFLSDHPHLVCKETASGLVVICIDCDIDEVGHHSGTGCVRRGCGCHKQLKKFPAWLGTSGGFTRILILAVDAA